MIDQLLYQDFGDSKSHQRANTFAKCSQKCSSGDQDSISDSCNSDSVVKKSTSLVLQAGGDSSLENPSMNEPFLSMSFDLQDLVEDFAGEMDFREFRDNYWNSLSDILVQ